MYKDREVNSRKKHDHIKLSVYEYLLCHLTMQKRFNWPSTEMNERESRQSERGLPSVQDEIKIDQMNV